jgi:carbonic anhydrase
MSSKFIPTPTKKLSALLCVCLMVFMYSCRKNDTETIQQQEKFTLSEALKLSEENLGKVHDDKPLDLCVGVHYGYEGHEGPDHWGELCESWSACGEGTMQSPINIKAVVPDQTLNPIEFRWEKTVANVVNNGHTIQFNVDPGSKIITNGKTYKLVQFHFHQKSEHTIQGKHYPLEVHFVHSNEKNKLAVVGVMYKEGAPNSLFTEFLADFPAPMSTFSSPSKINLKALLPKNLRYYNYKGSLTSPNCAEGVNWHIIKGVVTASKEQITALKKILHENNRPIQPLNGRTVRMAVGSGYSGVDSED